MNDQFREYATSAAFNLSLSKNMCDGMSYFRHVWLDTLDASIASNPPSLRTVQSLEFRGLLERVPCVSREGRQFNAIKLTKAGRLVFDLLVMAGLCVEKEIAEEAA